MTSPNSISDRIIEAGFQTDSGMDRYPYKATPCPACENAETHSLFAGVLGGRVRFWCQCLSAEVDYHIPGLTAPVVETVADLKSLKRWIPVNGKAPALIKCRWSDGDTKQGYSTFSHRNEGNSGCGGFEGEQAAEGFVRFGGVCHDHVTSKGVVPEFRSMGWWTHADADVVPSAEPSFCFAFDDCPRVVLVDIDPPADTPDAADLRDRITGWLEERGAPTAHSSKEYRRRAAFRIDDPQYYGGDKHTYTLDGVMTVELFTPWSRTHCKLYALDGPLPVIDPEEFANFLTEDCQFASPKAKKKAAGSREDDEERIEPNDFGARYGRSIRGRWAHDPDGGGYHQWTGTHWKPFPNSKRGQAQIWRELINAESDFRVRLQAERWKRAILAAVESAIFRELPLRTPDTLAVANGVVDLRTGRLVGFNKDFHSHRSVTPAAYRPEWRDEICMALLQNRYNPGVQLMDTEGIQTLIEFVGLCLTRRAQQHRGILFPWGQSGGGKGGTQHLLRETFGERALSTKIKALVGGNSDINVTRATLIQQDTMIVLVGEVDRDELQELLVLQRRVREECLPVPDRRRGAFRVSAWLVRCTLGCPPAIATVPGVRTVPGAASHAPPGTLGAG